MHEHRYSNIQKWLPRDGNVICDVCGRLRKQSECTLSYGTGEIPNILACIDGCADYRHPCNSPPPVIFDGQPLQDARPEGTDVYISNVQPSIYRWSTLPPSLWGSLNAPNTYFNMNGVWLFGYFGNNAPLVTGQ